jgi:hypothetical protein
VWSALDILFAIGGAFLVVTAMSFGALNRFAMIM